MSIEFINFGPWRYPKFQAEGFSSQFCWSFAQRFCKGDGFDIGCGRPEWCLPGAQGIDLNPKHVHILTFEHIYDYLQDRKYVNILHGQKDLNHSFTVVAEKII
ncbi:hypothetical protein EB118_16440 [bacterium]|nr:hypothetical protein [bacterium]